MYYSVSFQYSENVYCTNLATGTYEAVERQYSKYPWFSIKEATPGQVEEAKRKGMPVITCK